MSDIDQNEDNALPVQDELTTLKARADFLGVSYHPSIGVEKLREKITAKLNDEPAPDDAPAPVALDKSAPVADAPETEGQKRRRLRLDATKLIRINVTCMNPAKKEWDGEIFSVGNSSVPTQRKFVPFNTEEGYHVPHIIYEMMKAREFPLWVTEKSKNGVAVRKAKMKKEFAIEVLPPLTPQELKELAQRQAMAAGKED